MPDFGRRDFRAQGPGPQEPSLDAIRTTDSFVDALAGGRPVVPQDAADAELAALLGGWRDELRWPPATGLISEADAVAALNAGMAEKRSGLGPERWTATQKRTGQNRNRRGLSVLGASAAAVLCIGGFGALVAGAGPGDALYGVRTMLFGNSKQVRDDQVGLAAKTELNQVQTLIAQGDWEQAQDKLVAVSTQVATIDDQEQKQALLDQFNDLSAKVVERNPEATAPPGVVYTVPPSSAALVPAVEPTSTPSAPSLSSTPTTSTSSEAASSTSASGSTTAPPTSATPTTTPTSAVPTSAAPTSSGPTSAGPTSAGPNSAGPNSAGPTTTTAAPVLSTTAVEQSSAAAPVSAAPTTPATSDPEAPRAAGTTAASPPADTPAGQTPAQSASVASATDEQSAPAEVSESVPSAPLTTTVPVPVPAGG